MTRQRLKQEREKNTHKEMKMKKRHKLASDALHISGITNILWQHCSNSLCSIYNENNHLKDYYFEDKQFYYVLCLFVTNKIVE